MSAVDVIAAVNTLLSGVTGIGRVHSYQRLLDDKAIIESLCKPTGEDVIRCWFVTRDATNSQGLDQSCNQDHDVHTIRIDGYLTLADATNTDATFQALIELIRAKFRTSRTLGISNVCADNITVRVDHAMLGGYALCHHAQFTLPVHEYVYDAAGAP